MSGKKWLTLFLTAVMAAACVFGSISVQAAQQVTVAVDNTGGDENPFMRIFPNNKICGSGGPFRVSMEIRVEKWRRMSGHTNDGDVFVNALFGDTQGCQKHFSGNCDWTPVHFSFSNITKVMIPGSGLCDYGLIDIGAYYVKAVVSVRDFKITDRAGNVVYSFDTDPDLLQVEDLRDIGEVNPEPMVLNAAFGQSGAANYPVTRHEKAEPEKPKPEKPSEKPAEKSLPEKPEASKPAQRPGADHVEVSSGQGDEPDKPTDSQPVTEHSSAAEPESVPAEAAPAPGEESYPSELEKSGAETVIVKKLNVPFIVTLSVLCVLVAAAAVIAILFLVRKKKAGRQDGTEQTDDPEEKN